jgi:hypothetical protein
MARIRLNAFPATYTPIPFQEMAYMAEKQQERIDKGQTLNDELEDSLLKIKALDVDKPKRNAKIQEFRDQLSTLYDQSGGNYGKMMPGLRDLTRKVKYETTYGDLADINEKYNQYATLSSEFDKAEKEGKFSGLGQYMKNYALSLPLMQYEAVGGHSRDPQSGVSNRIGWGDLSQLPDVGKELSTWVDDYKADRYAGKTLVPTNAGYLVKETNEVVKYDDVARDAMTWALENPSFSRVNEVIGAFAPPDATKEISLGKDKSGKEVKTTLTGKVAGLYDFYSGAVGALAGRESYTKTDVSMLKDWIDAMNRRQSQAAPSIEPQTFESSYTGWRQLDNAWEGDSFIADAQGNIQVGSIQEAYRPGMTAAQIKDYENRNVKQANDLKKKYDNVRSQIPALQGKSDTYVRDFMSKAYTNSGMSFSEYNLPDFNYKELAPQVLGDLTSKAVFASTAEGKSLKGTFTSIAKDLGYTSNNELEGFKQYIKKEAMAGNIKLAPFSPLGKPGYSVEVVDTDGNPTKLIITSSAELERAFNWVYPLYQNLEQGKLGFSTTKLLPEDVGTYTGIASRNGEPVWYAGRVLNKENTAKTLQGMGMTKEQAQAIGIEFTADGNLIDPNINQYIEQAANNWLNGRYMRPYRNAAPKNVLDITEEEGTTEIQ